MNQTPAVGGHIHLVAICGVGMASLAGLLQARGYRPQRSRARPPRQTGSAHHQGEQPDRSLDH
jgi:UDP-N-acetylmuramate-alanine ligase